MPAKARYSRRPKRAVEWFDTIFNMTVPPGNVSVTPLDSNILPDEKKGMTLQRTLIKLQYRPTVPGNTTMFSSGICMITADAFAVPTLPDPGDPDEQPGWLWRDAVVVMSDSSAISRQGADFDLKAKRKFAGEDIRMVLIQETGGSASSVSVTGLIRMLWAKS